MDKTKDLTTAEQLAQKEAELEAAKKGLESITYTISHDLRAPLRTIDSFSQALVEEFSNQLPEEAMQDLARIRSATGKMQGMIDELLELARVGRRQMDVQEVNLSRLAGKIVEELSIENPQQNVEVIIDENMLTMGDSALLKTLLYQLFHNSWKFTAGEEKPRIEFHQTEKDGLKCFSLSDNGQGFDVDYYDHVFEPFKHLHSDKELIGMGVGLAIAQQIVMKHHGKIWADSEIDQGATFYFTLGPEFQI
ncbi:MAG: ATP-binding protein [Gammaproteobacteria bacterium]|nr:ATP-binding protein [Gammaproteobacteria bacterium]